MGTLYHVYRRTSPDGAFEYLGFAGEKQYADQTIPKGVTQLEYKIHAIRSTATGQSAFFLVNFGSNGGTPLPTFQPAGKRAA